jgi:hypothetical protein
MRGHYRRNPEVQVSLEIALAQAEMGRRVFPVSGKRPLVRWTAEATTKTRRLISWWHAWPDAGVGWAIPPGLVVVDIDHPELFFASALTLPPAPGQLTTRGIHLLYSVDPSVEVKQGPIPGGDLKIGGKGYVKIYHADAFTNFLEVTFAPGDVAA